MDALPATDSTNQWETFQEDLNTEFEQSRRALDEVNLMLEQSQVELAKLTQRNASITSHLQQIQSQFDTISREDIRMAYTSALEAQQRLWVMRGQIEKLQSDQANLQKLVDYLGKIDQFLSEAGSGLQKGKNGGSASMLEMVIKAQESERQRLSRQMHDGPAQTLSNFIVQTEIAARYFDMDPNKAREELNHLKTAAMAAFQKVRTFIFELRPMMLDDLGLIPTLRRYVEAFKEQNGLEVSLDVKGKERRLEPTQEAVLFRTLQELMGNAARHNAGQPVKVQISVQLILEDVFARVSVSDNGKGFDPEAVQKMEGIGLKVIRERIEMLGGEVEIDTATGKGCKITVQIPCSESM